MAVEATKISSTASARPGLASVIVAATDRGQTFGVRVPGNVFVEHTLDDGPVPPDNVVCRLLAPYSMRCVPLLWRTKDIPRSDTGVNRASVGGMEDDGVDYAGRLDGVSVRVRGDPQRARKAITSRKHLSCVAKYAMIARQRSTMDLKCSRWAGRPLPPCLVRRPTNPVQAYSALMTTSGRLLGVCPQVPRRTCRLLRTSASTCDQPAAVGPLKSPTIPHKLPQSTAASVWRPCRSTASAHRARR
jgi:hypothetical protein